MGKAYARRARRLGVDRGADRAAAGRSRFVLLVMVLLGSGLVASLWLSTTAAADSYRLDKARLAARELSERSELLRMDITSMESAPALARSARQLGMVPASDVARLVAQPDGSVRVVGTPKAAVAPAPPPAPAQPAPSPNVPSQSTPTQNTPTQNTPTQNTPTQNVPSQNAPTQNAPTRGVPGQNASTQGAPGHGGATQQSPALPSRPGAEPGASAP